MWTKSLAELPDAEYWKLVLPDHFKLTLFVGNDTEKELAINTLKKLGFTPNEVKNKLINFNNVSYKVVCLLMDRDPVNTSYNNQSSNKESDAGQRI
jgi:hypothetical protein